MNFKPILFNTEMVESILDGRKTQTRRIIKPQPANPRWNNIGWLGWDDGHGYRMKPPCEVGDILWVRETFCHAFNNRYVYKAGIDASTRRKIKEDGYEWHPSIHMPKEAARIFLRVRNVWVDQLMNISEADCIAEGIVGFTKDGKLFKYATQSGDMPSVPWQDMPENPKHAFFDLWNSTIKHSDRDEYGWLADPWVWVIEFERCTMPEEWHS